MVYRVKRSLLTEMWKCSWREREGKEKWLDCVRNWIIGSLWKGVNTNNFGLRAEKIWAIFQWLNVLQNIKIIYNFVVIWIKQETNSTKQHSKVALVVIRHELGIKITEMLLGQSLIPLSDSPKFLILCLRLINIYGNLCKAPMHQYWRNSTKFSEQPNYYVISGVSEVQVI